jgi:DNA-binding IclR family transcriptional regulator
MLLAESDDVSTRLPDQLVGLTSHSITDHAALQAELAKIHKAGLAFEYCESNPSVACVAAPVFDSHKNVVAALSISVPIPRWDASTPEHWAAFAQEGARELSTALGA